MNFYKVWGLFFFVMGLVNYYFGILFLLKDLVVLVDWEFFSLISCSFVMTLLLDYMSLLFMGSVFFISSMVVYYSSSYMVGDNYSLRFLYLMNLFVLSMVLMIVSPNLFSILIGWDGLGLVSYCLVIYFQNIKSYSAGMLTILTNRIGDVAILLCIAWLFNNGSWYFLYYNFYTFDWSFYVILLVILASFTKSAQIPFSSWLPAAMAAPTPVSALVHSSTLVTAGVYLLIRFSNLFVFFDLSFFLLLASLTMFMSGLGANFEFDLKKIIALSTLSQLGLMVGVLFIGGGLISFFHLLTHAFFSALLFLCAGLIIHCVNDTQDIRYMGVLSYSLPFTLSCFCVANLSLCGLPFLSGFYSKDLALEYLQFTFFNGFIFLIYLISVGLTVSYSIRLIYFLVLNYSGLSSCCLLGEESDMNYPMIFLVLMAIISGSFLSWLMFPFPYSIYLCPLLKILPLLMIFLSGYLALEMSFFMFNSSVMGLSCKLFYSFVSSMWFMPSFSTFMLNSKFLSLSYFYSDFINAGWGEYLISNLLVIFMNYLSKINLLFQNNNVKFYFLTFILLFFFIII
uniref:NADH-ubiquinone oxidoreductase chain 5 n=1 Tax=Largus sp. TaxID=2931298 RepID=A0A8T9ZXJ7_9HEMI|nr:NADH dehydrogenase subunit 5 [Largus sp.]